MKCVLWCAVPAIFGLAGYFAVTVARSSGGPKIEYPREVNLGERALGDLVVGHFFIANRGTQELVIDEIRTNCSCTGMEREQDGRFIRVDQLRLKPQERVDLVVRVAVRGADINSRMNNLILFRTNDPVHKQGVLNVLVPRVTGVVSIWPKSFIFGAVGIGAEVRQVIEVYDSAHSPRVIDRVTNLGSSRVSARLLPDTASSEPRQAAGTLIGRVEITVDTSTATEVDSKVQIDLAGDGLSSPALAVAGKVVGPIEVRPSALFLPRQAGDGPIFWAQTLFSGKQALSLTLESTIDGLTAEIPTEPASHHRVVRIVWDPAKLPVAAGGARHMLRFRAKNGDVESLIDLPVSLQP